MLKQLNRSLKFGVALIISVILTLGLSISLQSLFAAWTAPIFNPPMNNIADLNLSGGLSVATNALVVGNFTTNGNIGIGGQLNGNGAASAYGALSINGSKNGWSGINFGTNGTLMMHPSYSGFYKPGDAGWRWYVTDAGDVQNSGDINFTKSNPYLNSASYLVIPGGAYFNSGTVYTVAPIQARGGIHNDNDSYLTISGGTVGNTYFSGNVGINTTAPTSKLDVRGTVSVTGINNVGVMSTSPSIGVWGKGLAGAMGVYGSSVSGRGVYGESVSGGSDTAGVYGYGSYAGVYGYGGNYGVLGMTNSASGNGVYGYSASGYAVSASSNTGYGIYSYSNYGDAVYGWSNRNADFRGGGGEYGKAGVWYNASDRNVKENFIPIDNKTILDKIIQLPVTQWNYKKDTNKAKHIGPVAQDFYSIFGVGDDDKHISTIDPAGISLAGVKALDEKLKEQQIQIEKQASQNQQQQLQINELKEQIKILINK